RGHRVRSDGHHQHLRCDRGQRPVTARVRRQRACLPWRQWHAAVVGVLRAVRRLQPRLGKDDRGRVPEHRGRPAGAVGGGVPAGQLLSRRLRRRTGAQPQAWRPGPRRAVPAGRDRRRLRWQGEPARAVDAQLGRHQVGDGGHPVSGPQVSGGPLAGLRVLDTASLYAGPFISTVLADHGADVIKVEPPGGDPYRVEHRPLWVILARDKRSVTINLGTEAGCDLLRRLAGHIDVLVLNMLPHQLERRGLTWDRLSAINPDLVLVCVTSFGLDGPNAELPGSGTLGEAFAGLTHLTGHPDSKPMLASVPLGDAVTGWVGAFGVLAACYARAQGGAGQLIDVNPVD